MSLQDLQELKNKAFESMKDDLLCPDSDNPILYTIQFYRLLGRHNLFGPCCYDKLFKAIMSLRERPGLYNRRPGYNKKKDQHDNYTAIACSVMFCEEFQLFAEEIDNYGRKHFYSYNNVPPYRFKFSCWRQGFDVFLFRVCADRYPGIINYFWFMGKIFFEFMGRGKDKNHTTSHMLSWLRFEAIGHKWYVKPIHSYWKKKMLKKYSINYIDDIISIYHKGNEFFEGLLKNDN